MVSYDFTRDGAFGALKKLETLSTLRRDGGFVIA